MDVCVDVVGDLQWLERAAATNLWREEGSATAVVNLHIDDDCIELTLDEARGLAQALLRLVAVPQ